MKSATGPDITKVGGTGITMPQLSGLSSNDSSQQLPLKRPLIARFLVSCGQSAAMNRTARRAMGAFRIEQKPCAARHNKSRVVRHIPGGMKKTHAWYFATGGLATRIWAQFETPQ